MRVRVLGFDGDRAAVLNNGLADPPLALESDAEAVIGGGHRGLEPDRFFEASDRVVLAALHEQRGAQVVLCHRRLRIQPKRRVQLLQRLLPVPEAQVARRQRLMKSGTVRRSRQQTPIPDHVFRG